MTKQIPREVYELLNMLGLSNFCAGRIVEGYGIIIPEIDVTEFEARPREIYSDVEYSSIVVPEEPRPEAIPADAFGIIVLLNSAGASIGIGTMGHSALLIGNERIGWTYISKDGYGKGLGPIVSQSKYIIKQFSSFAKFKASAHNHELQSGFAHSDIYGNEIDSLDYRIKLNESERPIVRYDKALILSTDSASNILALMAAVKSAKKPYVLVIRDCSDVTTKALRAAGKKDGEPSPQDMPDQRKGIRGTDIKPAPKAKQKRIKERNPDAREIE